MTFTQPYGVTIGNGSASGSLNASAITDMNNLGVTWLRYQVNWSLIDATGTTNQNPATYSWGAYDSAVSQCNSAGINVLLSVMKPPAQFTTGSNKMAPSYTATFAAQVASRYNGGGHGTIAGIEFNEDYNYGSDNLSVPDPDVTALVATMKAVYPAVKAVNGSMLCGIPCKLQRNSLGYTDWFETLLNPSTGLYKSGVFQGDWLNFHYYTGGPLSGGVPVSLDPTVDVPSWNGGNGIPSITHAWQIIHSKMTQYGVNLPVYLTEFGPYINTNPGRNSAAVVSQATQWQYYKDILDSCRTSGVVARVFFFTLGYYTGYAAPNYRDGCSLVQGTSGSPTYTTAYNSLKSYTAQYPSWGSGGTGGALTALPSALSFSAIAGGVSPATQSVTVTNSDSSSASYSASSDASWLSVSPTSGTIASGGHATAAVSVNSTSLVVGTYSGTVTWTAGALSDSTTVTLTVSSATPPPALAPLTAYFASAPSAVIPTACQVYTTAGTQVDVNVTTALGTALGWGEMVSQGTSAPWAAASAIGGPSGFGFVWGAKTLEHNDLQIGTYTAAVRLNMVGAGAVSITADIHCRAYKWNAATGYTPIGDGGLTGQTIATTKTVFAPTFTTTALTSFGNGDKLYIDIKINITANTGPSTASIQLNDLSTDTTTFTGSSTACLVTPGYSATAATAAQTLLPGQYLRNCISNFLFGTQQTVDFGNPHTVINTPAIQSQVKAAGLQIMRFPVSNSTTTYSDAEIDSRLAACNACGCVPLVIIGHDAGLTYAQHVVTYIGSRCLLYEFYNEPDLNVNIPGGWSEYLADWNSWIPTLRAINTHAAFGGPALGVVASFSSYLQPWLSGTVSSGILPDFVSFHDYPCGSQPSAAVCATNAGNFANDANSLRSILVSVLGSVKGNAMPIAITEWNIDYHNPPVSYANQANSANASYINVWYTNALNSMANAGVAMACQFDCADGAESGQADLISTTSPYPAQAGLTALSQAIASWLAQPTGCGGGTGTGGGTGGTGAYPLYIPRVFGGTITKIAIAPQPPPGPPPSGALSLTINAVPYPILGTSLMAKSMVGRRGELSVTVYDVTGASHIQQYQQVALYSPSGVLAYSGYVTDPEEMKPGYGPVLVTTFTATDQRWLAEKRILAKLYRNQTTDFMANDIFTSILSSEGVTIGQIAPGLVVPIANFGYVSVAAALDAIVVAASSSGTPYYWTIDQNLALWVVPYAAVTGPTIDGTQIDDGRLSGVIPKVKRANPLYRNTQYAVGGVQETASNDETRAGDGQTRVFPYRYPLNGAPSIFTLNGTAKSLGVKGQTGFNYYYAVGDNTIAQDDSQTVLVSTDRLRMVYVGQESAVFQAQNTGAVAAQAAIDGSSGIVEAVLNDSTIASHAQGTALVGQQITRYCQNATRFVFATQSSGLVPGQLSTISYGPYGFANTQMLIEEVDLSDQQDGVMLWNTITAVMGPYDTTWSEFFGNLFKPPGFQLASNISLGIALNSPLLPSTTLFPSPTLYPQG